MYGFFDARFFNAFAIFHALITPNLSLFPLSGVGFRVFKQTLYKDLAGHAHANGYTILTYPKRVFP